MIVRSFVMEIETQALTTGEVAADGGAISLGFVDSTGNPATIRLSINQVGALAMTLPGLIDKALQTRLAIKVCATRIRWRHGRSSNRPIRPRHGHAANDGRFQRLLLHPAPAAERT